jgi:hypothetical protein
MMAGGRTTARAITVVVLGAMAIWLLFSDTTLFGWDRLAMNIVIAALLFIAIRLVWQP